MSARPLGAGALLVALGVAAAPAQGPEADWSVLETERFHILYETPAEAWTRRLASRLESIRDAVEAEVGHVAPQRIDVLVADPLASANGSAWPLLGRPRMILWTTPPAARSTLARSNEWSELLAVHETVHLAHLLRRSRNPLRRAIEGRLLPIGPLPSRLPRWAIEGYATLLEGGLTGAGRPASALRAVVLRARARAGRLPGYAALSGDDEAILGTSMAYLAGSRFLEWQVGRTAIDDPLPKLWAAATARDDRGFDAAWERVFGEPPRTSWARFVAESAADAIAEERRRAPGRREGEVWLDLRGATGAPAISPSGDRVAAIVREPRRAPALVVWTLAPTPATPPRPAAADPLDPPAAPRAPRRRAEAGRLVAPAGVGWLDLRYLPNGDALLVAATFRAPDGRRHADLAVWSPERRRLERTTRGADLFAADPAPGGRRAVAVRWRHGTSTLVAVDLTSGDVRPLGEPTIDAIHDAPRISPDGRRLAWLEHREGRWRLRTAPLDLDVAHLGEATEPELPFGGEPTHLAWRFDGSHLYVSAAAGDSIEIDAVGIVRGARSHRVTRSVDAAMAPAPTPDGRELFYLGLDADGLELRRLELDATTLQDVETGSATLAAPPRDFAASPIGAPRPYGPGRGETTPLVAGQAGTVDGALEAGIRVGDLVGRWEVTLLGAARGDAGRGGGSVAAEWRGSRLRFGVRFAEVESALGRWSVAEVDVARRRSWSGGRLDLRLGAARVRPDGVDDRSSTRFGLRAELRHRVRIGSLDIVPSGALERIEESPRGGAAIRRERIELSLRHRSLALSLGARRARGSAAAGRDAIRLGGAPSSLAPWLLEPSRVDHPALQPSTLAGRELESFALHIAPGAGPLALFAERHRVRTGPGRRSEPLDLAGVEVSFGTPPRPVVGLPALELRAGVASVLGGPGEGSTRWWLGLLLPLGPTEPLVAR